MTKRSGVSNNRAFKAAVKRSSFGTPAARKVRSYTNDVTAARIVKRSQAVAKSAKRRNAREW